MEEDSTQDLLKAVRLVPELDKFEIDEIYNIVVSVIRDHKLLF